MPRGGHSPRSMSQGTSSTAAVLASKGAAVCGRSPVPKRVDSWMPPPPVPGRSPSTDDGDFIHQHVLHFLRTHPRVADALASSLVKKSPGIYNLDDHEVEIEWQHSADPWRSGHLVVVDGPLRQPLEDYLQMGEANAQYNTDTIAKTSNLHHVPKERRMTFDDTHKKYTRLEAMKVAKEQASIREKAAECTKEGKLVPEDLVTKYNKALRQKLRIVRAREDSPTKTMVPEQKAADREDVEEDKEDEKEAEEDREKEKEEEDTEETKEGQNKDAQKPGQIGSADPKPQEPCALPAPDLSCPPAVAMITHRGISLNGLPMCVPSYMPPLQALTSPCSMPGSMPSSMHRSWSGTRMQAPGQALSWVPAVKQQGAPPPPTATVYAAPNAALTISKAVPTAFAFTSPSYAPVAVAARAAPGSISRW